MSEVTIRVYELEEFTHQIDLMAESMPDQGIVFGDLRGQTARITHDSDTNVARLAEFVYPSELFATGDGTDDLASADTRLAATGIFPPGVLDMDCPDVQGYDEFKQYAREVASDLDEPLFFVGGWSPGNYRITGNPDNSKPRKIGAMAFQERVFDDDGGTTALHKMHLGFPGTVVIEADRLDDRTVAFARGERDELPIEERTDDRMEPERINEVLRSLEHGDRVQVNDRNRPLTVVPRNDTRQIGIAGHDCVFLLGNGTDYRISIPNRESQYPKLEWTSDSEYIGEIDVLTRAEDGEQQVVA